MNNSRMTLGIVAGASAVGLILFAVYFKVISRVLVDMVLALF